MEIIGISKNMWGPKQDIILGKMGGKAIRTNVAKGMSGSPVYIDGKLIGAVSLRTQRVLAGRDLRHHADRADAGDQRQRHVPARRRARLPTRSEARVGESGQRLTQCGGACRFRRQPSAGADRFPAGHFRDHRTIRCAISDRYSSRWACAPCRAAAAALDARQQAGGGLGEIAQPGRSVAGVLVDGDMGITGFGTVTYNDGKRVLAFGHPFFNLGPVDMPMAKSEVVMMLASQFQPNKMAQCHGHRRRAAAGPPQRHHGRTRRDVADDPG